jgi:hypothetical protein
VTNSIRQKLATVAPFFADFSSLMENLNVPVGLPLAWINTQTVQIERNAFASSCTSKHLTDTSFLLLDMLFNDAE